MPTISRMLYITCARETRILQPPLMSFVFLFTCQAPVLLYNLRQTLVTVHARETVIIRLRFIRGSTYKATNIIILKAQSYNITESSSAVP